MFKRPTKKGETASTSSAAPNPEVKEKQANQLATIFNLNQDGEEQPLPTPEELAAKEQETTSVAKKRAFLEDEEPDNIKYGLQHPVSGAAQPQQQRFIDRASKQKATSLTAAQVLERERKSGGTGSVNKKKLLSFYDEEEEQEDDDDDQVQEQDDSGDEDDH